MQDAVRRGFHLGYPTFALRVVRCCCYAQWWDPVAGAGHADRLTLPEIAPDLPQINALEAFGD